MNTSQRRARRARLHRHLATSDGVVTTEQLRSFGLDDRAIAALVDEGALTRAYRGVYRSTVYPKTPEGALRAALAACSAARAAVRASSAHHLGLFEHPPDRPQLGSDLVRIGPVRRRRGYDFHPLRPLLHEDLVIVRGIRCTSPLRTILDLGRNAKNQGQRRTARLVLRAATLVDDGLPLRLAARVANEPRVPGNVAVRALLAELPGSLVVRSPLEVDFPAFCRAHGIPLPEMNAIVEGLEVDAAWLRERLIVELDTRAYHDDPFSFERDRERDGVLLEAGWRVLRITRARLESDPVGVALQIVRLLGIGAA